MNRIKRNRTMSYPPEISVCLQFYMLCAHRDASKRIPFKTRARSISSFSPDIIKTTENRIYFFMVYQWSSRDPEVIEEC